jgi:hypothetical protein
MALGAEDAEVRRMIRPAEATRRHVIDVERDA